MNNVVRFLHTRTTSQTHRISTNYFIRSCPETGINLPRISPTDAARTALHIPKAAPSSARNNEHSHICSDHPPRAPHTPGKHPAAVAPCCSEADCAATCTLGGECTWRRGICSVTWGEPGFSEVLAVCEFNAVPATSAGSSTTTSRSTWTISVSIRTLSPLRPFGPVGIVPHCGNAPGRRKGGFLPEKTGHVAQLLQALSTPPCFTSACMHRGNSSAVYGENENP